MKGKTNCRVYLKGSTLELPLEVAKRLSGKEMELTEVEGILLLKPVGLDPISKAEGWFRDKKFSYEKYLRQKEEDKEQET